MTTLMPGCRRERASASSQALTVAGVALVAAGVGWMEGGLVGVGFDGKGGGSGVGVEGIATVLVGAGGVNVASAGLVVMRGSAVWLGSGGGLVGVRDVCGRAVCGEGGG